MVLTLLVTAVHNEVSHTAVVARTQIYGLQKHFIRRVDIASRPSAPACPVKTLDTRGVDMAEYLYGNTGHYARILN